MHQRIKERLVGAAVLVVLAVIFIPMILTGPVDTGAIEKTNIPTRPDDNFKSKPKLVPITDTIRSNDAETPINNSEESAVSEPVVIPELSETETVSQKSEKVATETASSVKNPVATEDVKEDIKEVQKTIQKNKPVGLSAWVVQLGSFSSKVNADKLNLSLRKAGFPAFVEPLKQDKNNKIVYRVRVGPELLRSDADKLLSNIKVKMNMDGIVLRYP